MKQEQNIYNVVFNEIIRQVSVECVERGELLADLRKRYAKLLDKIPRHVKRYCIEMANTSDTMFDQLFECVMNSTHLHSETAQPTSESKD